MMYIITENSVLFIRLVLNQVEFEQTPDNLGQFYISWITV